jgi:hypothetical protein
MKRHDAAVFGLYGLLTVILTLPLVLNLNTTLIGQSSDVYHNPWADWWTKKALTEGLDFYYTDYMFYPQGASLVFHSFSHSNTFIILLLSPLVGHFAAYNITILLVYALSGFSMYLLVSYLTGCRPAAFVAGLVFAFYPYHIFESARLILSTTQWIPLFALALIRMLRETGSSRARQMALAVLWFLLNALSSWHLMSMLSMWTALYLLYGVLFERSEWAPQAFRALGLLAVITGLVVAPFLWPIIHEMATSGASYAISTSGPANDLLSFVLPNQRHPLFGALTDSLNLNDEEVGFVNKDSGYLGYMAVGLAISGAVTARCRARFWLLAGLVFFILSLGAQVTFNGVPLHSFKLPWAIPIISVFRYPIRFNVLLFFCLAVLVGYGSHWLYDKIALQSRMRARLIMAFAAGLVLLEYMITPFPTMPLDYSPFWHRLAQEEGDFAIIDYPRGNRQEKYYMLCQTLHGKKMVEGRVSRFDQDADSLSDPLLQQLGKSRVPDSFLDIDKEFAKLDLQGIRYIILHKRFLEADEVEAWRAWFPFQPYYEDEYLLVFRTAPRYGEDFQFATELGEGIGVVDADVSTHNVVQGESLDVSVVWGAREAPRQDWTAFLKLVSPTGQEVQRAYFDLFPDWPTSKWGDNAVARGRWTVQVDPYMAQGDTYAMTLGLANLETGEQLGTVELGQLNVRVVERTFEMPQVEIESDAVFGDRFRLLGYDVRQAGDQMTVTLHWKALQRVDTAYQFFVHLIDPISEKLVAQADVMPYHWTYPTFWWEADEIVSDEITLPLAGVPQGSYRLEIGVYDPDSGERLPLSDGDGRQPADRLVLPEMVEIAE